MNNKSVTSPAAQMPPADLAKASWSQLQLVLGFFPRIDTKLSVVLGLCVGMLAVLAPRLPQYSEWTWLSAHLTIFLLLALIASFYFLWIGSFPQLKGGERSLIYFRTIAEMSEDEFLQAYSRLNDEGLAHDLLTQTHCNARILTCKFAALQRAYVAALVAVIPWTTLLLILPKPM